MIKLATVFSGIGAIEHALDRMNLDHKIIFACDNGDVDILSKKINTNINNINLEMKELESLIREINIKNENNDEYVDHLNLELESVINDYQTFLIEVKLSDDLPYLSYKLISSALDRDYLNKSTKKIYEDWIKSYECTPYDIKKNDINFKFESLKKIIKINNDYKRLEGKTFRPGYLLNSNDTEVYNKSVNIIEFKRIEKHIKSICDRLSMLHEQINTSYILNTLSKIDSYQDKKDYVDNLYKSKNKSNQVKKSYLANYDIGEKDFHWNASFLDGKQYKNKVDLFVGGSPCQSFSLVGKQRGLNDTRGTLFYEFARLVDEIQPKVFIYENVKAILSNDNGATWDTVSNVFDNLNYDWTFDILNSKDYGIPQNRERVFVVGFRNDLNIKDFKFPQKLELNTTMQDYLLDNVSEKYYLSEKGIEFVTSEKNLTKRYTQINGEIQLCQKKNQQFNWHGDFVYVEKNNDMKKTLKKLDKYFLSDKVKDYVLSSGTKGFYSKPEIDLKVARPLLTSMHKMHRAGVDNYVTTEGRIRKLTPRECLRLMGFCDSFDIVVSDTAMYQQAGNSIVVDVLIEIVKQILYALNV